ncbi:MAG: cyclodeaminase/cyclohydrolase family protein [Kutzneria sp.]|nr:cyclodeaminase/cyclohydrolase family protein [Kutzneria sp.]MBV9844282.1 cyclodeaminase/cyclohydrolase family protein [Kutzneria sp.]
MSESLLGRTVGGLLADVAARTPAPGGGAVAAITAASAAALVAMAARFSSGDVTELASPADELRARLAALADADSAAYAEVLSAYRLPVNDPTRHQRISEALRAATETPRQMVKAATEVARLAGRLTDEGNPNLAGDSRVAELLARAAAEAAAALVDINVRVARRHHEARKHQESSEIHD